MFYLIVLALIALLIIARIGSQAKRRGTLRPFINKLIIGSFLIALILLAITGKIHWIGAAIGFLLLIVKKMLLLAMRFWPVLAQIYRHRAKPKTHTASMSVDEAYKVLGLEVGSSRDAVITAHRKLIQKVHPDLGGNDHLAAQINDAKSLLLEYLDRQV